VVARGVSKEAAFFLKKSAQKTSHQGMKSFFASFCSQKEDLT
jgi:hypothetical protein